jgi:ferredoxin-NADP reductase
VAGAAVLGRLTWRVATVVGARRETARATTIVLDVDGWHGHRAGQHLDVRLTAEDGYQAERSYSIASAPAVGRLELTVERIDDGEVSPYLTDDVRRGDRFEVRGPVGGYFVWNPDVEGDVLLVAGGSGVVPLMAMVRQRAADRSNVPTQLLYSDELRRAAGDGLDAIFTLTRSQPDGWTGFSRRVDAPMLAEVAPAEPAVTFVCGPTPFVEAVASSLVGLGRAPERIKTERFGPTGG